LARGKKLYESGVVLFKKKEQAATDLGGGGIITADLKPNIDDLKQLAGSW
jgi:hypothetical protein